MKPGRRGTGRHARIGAGIALVLAALGGPVGAQTGDPEVLIVGTGDPRGLYVPAGYALAQIVGMTAPDVPALAIEQTGGSIENLVRLRDGEFDLVIATSGRAYQAVNGLPPFDALTAVRDLEAVLSLYPEPLTVVARAEADVTTLDDLWGKRINLGVPGTATRELLDLLLDAQGWVAEQAFTQALELPIADQHIALCSGAVDAVAYISAVPSSTAAVLAEACPVTFVAIEGDVVERILAGAPYLAPTVLPAGAYAGLDRAVPTIGPSALLVTRRGQQAAWTEAILQSLRTRAALAADLHPVLAGFDAAAPLAGAAFLPPHEGVRTALERPASAPTRDAAATGDRDGG